MFSSVTNSEEVLPGTCTQFSSFKFYTLSNATAFQTAIILQIERRCPTDLDCTNSYPYSTPKNSRLGASSALVRPLVPIWKASAQLLQVRCISNPHPISAPSWPRISRPYLSQSFGSILFEALWRLCEVDKQPDTEPYRTSTSPNYFSGSQHPFSFLPLRSPAPGHILLVARRHTY